jgi:hypothetical protein
MEESTVPETISQVGSEYEAALPLAQTYKKSALELWCW